MQRGNVALRDFLQTPFVANVGAEDVRFECRRCQRPLPPWCYEPVGEPFFRKHSTFPRQRYNPVCTRCWKEIETRFGANPKFNRDAYRYWVRYYGPMLRGGQTRGYLVRVDIDDLIDVWLEQNGLCALTGIEVSTPAERDPSRDPTAASVDRIDSLGNYDKLNIQVVCSRVNIMKSNLPQAEFLYWCGRITEHRAKKEDELLRLVD